MYIEQLLRPLELYLNSRAFILRMVDDWGINTANLADILSVRNDVIALRRRNAANWRPDEIKQLATELGLSTDAIIGLKRVALQLNELPFPVRNQLLKEARLNTKKIVIRCVDYNFWKYVELEQLAGTLRIWQDTYKLDTLLRQMPEKLNQLSIVV